MFLLRSPLYSGLETLGKGLPQPHRFVVDYRGLNTVTAGDGYPISSVSNVLDALSGSKKFAKAKLLMISLCILMFPWMTQIICVFLYLMILSCNVIPCMHIMIAWFVCTAVVMQPTAVYHMIFTGGTYINMSETGFAAALSVFVFKSLWPSHGPMQVRLYQYPFHTVGVDYVGELPIPPQVR